MVRVQVRCASVLAGYRLDPRVMVLTPISLGEGDRSDHLAEIGITAIGKIL
jgi:hypothetical protein